MARIHVSKLKLYLFLLITAFLPCSMLFAQNYEIKLQRPNKAGQKEKLTIKSHVAKNISMAINGEAQPAINEKYDLEAEGVWTAVAVDARGMPITISMQFDRFEKVVGAERTTVLPKGSVVTMTMKDGKPSYVMDGKPADEELTEPLNMLGLSPAAPDQATNDETFGTTDRKKVGDSWPVNAERATADLSKIFQILIKKENITGNTTLEKVVKVGDVECLQITCNMDIKNIDMSALLPAGLQVTKCEGKFAISGKYPTNVALNPAETSIKSSIAIAAHGAQDTNTPAISLDMKMDMDIEQSSAEVK